MGLVIGLQLVSGYSYEADASWLSKRTGKCQEKIRKTTYDRKTESSQSDAKKGKNGVFKVPKERKKRKESCNIMQKFMPKLQTMTVNKTKNPAI